MQLWLPVTHLLLSVRMPFVGLILICHPTLQLILFWVKSVPHLD